MPRTARLIPALLIATALLALVGCSDEDPTAGDGAEAAGPAFLLRIMRGDELLKGWNLEELRALPQQELDIGGDAQNGPWLRDVLEASSVGEWDHATVAGSGEGRAFDIELEIESGPAEDYILDITQRGTMKLAGEDLPKERWVRDVTEIRIDD